MRIGVTAFNALFDRALRLLAARSHSRAELERKLRRRGAPSVSLVVEVLDRLEELGYLDDEDFAYRRALKRASQGWGDRRIALDLKRLGIDARMARRVLGRVAGETSEGERLRESVRQWVERSGVPDTRPALKRLFDRLVRLGFSRASVRQCLDPYFSGLNWKKGK